MRPPVLRVPARAQTSAGGAMCCFPRLPRYVRPRLLSLDHQACLNLKAAVSAAFHTNIV